MPRCAGSVWPTRPPPAPEHWREVVPDGPGRPPRRVRGGGPCRRRRRGVHPHPARHQRTARPHPGSARADWVVPLPGEGMVAQVTADTSGEVYFCYADVATPLTVFTLGADGVPVPWPPHRAASLPPRSNGAACRTCPSTGSGCPSRSLRFPAPAAPPSCTPTADSGRPRQFGFSPPCSPGCAMAAATPWHTCAAAATSAAPGTRRCWTAQSTRGPRPGRRRGLPCRPGRVPPRRTVPFRRLRRRSARAGRDRPPPGPARSHRLGPAAPDIELGFPQLGLGAMWSREFGSVTDPEFGATRLLPYHRVLRTPPAAYPAVLLTGFHGDTRTGPAHPRKMCAALQERTRGPRPILLRYEHGVGHGPRASSPRGRTRGRRPCVRGRRRGRGAVPDRRALGGRGPQHAAREVKRSMDDALLKSRSRTCRKSRTWMRRSSRTATTGSDSCPLQLRH